MSKITGYWKRHLRPGFLNALRRFGGVPVPRTSTTVAEYAAESPACRVIAFPCALPESIPSRTIVGSLDEIEKTRAMIPNPVVRAKYERQLQGAGVQQCDEFVAILENGRTCHDSAIAITPDNRLLADASRITTDSNLPTNPLGLRYLPKPRHQAGCVATLSCVMPYNYYHWLMEALPRLALYERSGIHVDRFYAPAKHSFQRQFVHLAGIAPSQIERATVNRHLVADRLATSSLQLNVSRWKTDFLHQRFTGALDATTPPTLRVFISRRRRGKRLLTNDNEVFRGLKPLGFQRYDLERMPVAEQISLFYNAECVVGPHGAGMTNTVFCRPGTKVLEVNTPYRTSTCFYDIAHYRKLTYRLHVAKPVHDAFFSFHPDAGVGDSDMWVEPVSFAASVAGFLDAAPAREATERPAA